ncbi:hypothetical protein ILFOPFJJ_04412 [Ensifer psoraleae]|nr:hypothetical protein [Sinorhizobium psoraleae]
MLGWTIRASRSAFPSAFEDAQMLNPAADFSMSARRVRSMGCFRQILKTMMPAVEDPQAVRDNAFKRYHVEP